MRYVSVVPALRVRSIERAARLWYALGFELASAFSFENDERLDVSSCDLSSAGFARFDAPGGAPVSVFLQVDPNPTGCVTHWMLTAPADVDAAAQRLAAAEIQVDEAPCDQPWGMRDLRVRDSDGNELVIGAALEEDLSA